MNAQPTTISYPQTGAREGNLYPTNNKNNQKKALICKKCGGKFYTLYGRTRDFCSKCIPDNLSQTFTNENNYPPIPDKENYSATPHKTTNVPYECDGCGEWFVTSLHTLSRHSNHYCKKCLSKRYSVQPRGNSNESIAWSDTIEDIELREFTTEPIGHSDPTLVNIIATLYVDCKMGLITIARSLQMDIDRIRKIIKTLGIEIRPAFLYGHIGKGGKNKTVNINEQIERLINKHMVKKDKHWFPKRRIIDGYWTVFTPEDHPRFKNKSPRIAEHILIAEKKMGRYIDCSENTHHINLNKLDNRPENLAVGTPTEHGNWHKSFNECIGTLLSNPAKYKLYFTRSEGYWVSTKNIKGLQPVAGVSFTQATTRKTEK